MAASETARAVTLREVTAATVRTICRLDVSPTQQGLVAPNAVSMAEAYFEPAAWFRGIYAGDDPVGFAMLYDPTRTPAPEDLATCYLWRFMIDARHQRRGYGAAALAQLIATRARSPECEASRCRTFRRQTIRATSTRASVSPSPVKWMRTKS